MTTQRPTPSVSRPTTLTALAGGGLGMARLSHALVSVQTRNTPSPRYLNKCVVLPMYPMSKSGMMTRGSARQPRRMHIEF